MSIQAQDGYPEGFKMIEQNPLTPTEFQVGRVVPISTSAGAPQRAVGMKLVPPKQQYVVGFLFIDHVIGPGSLVTLIEKRTGPKWMKGLLNGLGGKVEPGETAAQAMEREFDEEAGLRLDSWAYFTTLSGPDWTMDCFYAHGVDWMRSVITSKTEEPVDFYAVRDVVFNRASIKCVPNVPFMVTMALNYHNDAYGPYNITVAESHITGRKFAGSPTAETMAA